MPSRASDESARPTVGWVGIGDQGGPMAEAVLEAGYPLAVWARTPSKAEWLAGRGAKIVSDVTELGDICTVIGICVLDDAGVEDILSSRGLLAGLAPGSTVLVHSTVAPRTCRRLADQAAERQVDLLDAPVSGGGQAARAGKLSVMVGGDEAAFHRAEPVLQTFGGLIRHVGSVGSAQALKLVNNGLFVANVGNAWSALALVERLGVDREVAKDVLSASSGQSTALAALDPLLETEWGRHAWGVLAKDVRLLSNSLEDLSAPDGMLLLPSAQAAAAALFE